MDFRLSFLTIAGAFAAMASVATDAAAQTLSPNSDASATLSAGVRYRNLSGSGPTGASELHVFNSPYSAPGSTTGQVSYGASGGFSTGVSIAYSGSTLSTTVGATTVNRNIGAVGQLNYIQIQITKNGGTNAVSLTNISLNGGASLGGASVNAAPNSQVWKITGANLTNGFTIAGTLATNGLSGGGDSNFVQVEVGYVPPADSEGPVTSDVDTNPKPALLNGTVTLTANVSDENKGGSNIASADYAIDGGGWQPMDAEDGAFDSVAEAVIEQFTASSVGTHEACVRGTDAAGNTGVAACQTYLVTYKFDGFFSPIDNGAINLAKAGQAIPSKWRLTDANDQPISDPASFVSLSSYPINCTDFSGDPTDSVEEVASGSSGLQYDGDGYWQFNWKTPKTYAETCRAMYVEFNSGATSPVVKFRFKK